MLIGQYTSKLTEGQRLSIPKKFRSELGEELITARWYEGCLVIISKDNWSKLQKRLIGNTTLVTEPVRDIDRFIMASAFEIKLDDQGRFVVPEGLLTYSKITGEVVFIGLDDRVEVWAQDIWSEAEKGAEAKASEAIEKIAKRTG